MPGVPNGKESGSGTVVPEGNCKVFQLRELRAVALALNSFLQDIQGYHVQILSENATTVAYLNKRGGDKKQSPTATGHRDS